MISLTEIIAVEQYCSSWMKMSNLIHRKKKKSLAVLFKMHEDINTCAYVDFVD